MARVTEVDAGQLCAPTGSQEYIANVQVTEWHNIFGRFEENQNFRTDRLEYKRTGSEPGLVIIFNFEEFENTTARPGSSKDVDDIVTCLARLGFNINPKHIFNNLSKDEMLENVSEILAADHSQVNSVLVFVLTHGGPSNTLSTSIDKFNAEELWVKFDKCPSLEGKPKMFVIQACKGENHTTFLVKPEDTPLVPLSTFSSGYIPRDMIIVYSTMEGKYAYRDRESGSWLIQEICRNFTAYGRRDDVLTVLSRVSKCICRNYYTNSRKTIVKQVPVVVSTLSRKFYLNNNKDRHLVLNTLVTQDETLEKIKFISKKINSILGFAKKNNNT
ncbi:hypothetical protein WA026_018905 [Henosepilachna vigintioctopunctata]|uniref:Uncharacterized protein n=1 Tax=Henosepilachna vigintioctopunctata TaxID=420089 RepID=A0AAW1UHR5_9CUCU